MFAVVLLHSAVRANKQKFKVFTDMFQFGRLWKEAGMWVG